LQEVVWSASTRPSSPFDELLARRGLWYSHLPPQPGQGTAKARAAACQTLCLGSPSDLRRAVVTRWSPACAFRCTW
jgi:hypothetical protein